MIDFISVIITSFNRPIFLQRAINSVLNQDFKGETDLIIIDDGSECDVTFIEQQYGAKLRLIRQKNLGVSAARNNGVKLAQADWIAFLDDDDLWHRDKLAKQVKYLQDNPTYNICYTDEIWLRNNIEIKKKKKH